MAGKGNKASLIGAVGGIFIGAALLLFIVTIIMGSLKSQNIYGSLTRGGVGASPTINASVAIARASWNSTNATIGTLMSFMTIGVVLFGVLGITMVGAAIIGYITGAFA